MPAVERFAYYGHVGIPDADTSNPNRIRAVFNGALFRYPVSQPDGTTESGIFMLPRVMDREQIPGIPDYTSRFDVRRIDVTEEGARATEQSHVSADHIRGAMSTLNPEDARALVLPDGQVMFGITAATAAGEPLAAFFTGKYPFREEDFSAMDVAFEIRPGKNVLPLQENLAVYRPERVSDGRENGHEFTFLRKVPREDGLGIWTEERTITFPTTDWVGKEGRYGFTGGERIWVDRDNGIFRMLIHGFNRFRDADGREKVKYALGLGEFQDREDGTFDVRGIDNDPFFVYEQAIEHMGKGVEPNEYKLVIYAVGDVLEGEELLVAVTLRDQEIGLFGFRRQDVLRPFSPRPVVAIEEYQEEELSA